MEEMSAEDVSSGIEDVQAAQSRPANQDGSASEQSKCDLDNSNLDSTARADTFASSSSSSSSSSSRSRKRYSLPPSRPIPDVPSIPAHFLADYLAAGKPATLQQSHRTATAKSSEATTSRDLPLPPASAQQPPPQHPASPSLADRRRAASSSRRSLSIHIPSGRHAISNPPTPRRLDSTRRKSLSETPARVIPAVEDDATGRGRAGNMHRFGRDKSEDLFLELAAQDAEAERPSRGGERTSSRLSFANNMKRRSLPPPAERNDSIPNDGRPSTSGQLFANRPSSRIDTTSWDVQRYADRHRNSPGYTAYQQEDATSASGLSNSGRRHRYPSLQERTTMSPSRLAENLRSPELPHYGRRRPSFGASSLHKGQPSHLSTLRQNSQGDSPSPETKQSNADSASVDSDTADTVWDELDDLKSRIKKLELTGKRPSSSGVAVSAETSDRPRTATTAPTTIDSSPKHDKQKEKQIDTETAEVQATTHNIVGGLSTANIHPNLHSALARAKSLLNASLYRPLEATAADALQLVAMTGSAGPQGTTFSAAAIINGVTVSDRHVRRKADTMCRNLTDLCIALCEGKHEAPSVVSSPIGVSTPLGSSPSIRYPRSSLGGGESGIPQGGSRPMSRLEARRSSMLGSSRRGSSIGLSPSGIEDASSSEHDGTPSHAAYSDDAPRIGRSQSRLQRIRQNHYNNEGGEDEDPTIRPPSRAMTDFTRARPGGPREYSTPQRSPSLRDSLAVRRANAAAHDGNRGLLRVASLTSDSSRSRRFHHDPSTPSVAEEERTEDAEGEAYYTAPTHPARRVMSLNRQSGRRAMGDLGGRVSSMTQRRQQVAVE